MAPPSPRRSSRARTVHPQSQQSSVSSGTSGRLERSTRSLNKPSSGKSTPSASLSSEPLDEPEDTLLGRRRKRGHDDEQEKVTKVEHSNMANGSDDLPDEEDEAVRCICGSEDYPGRPPVEGPDADFFAGIELTEDVTGFFVQCDVCKVWQHGACVGIFSAESSPDEYFCEQCRKDLHKIHTASNGQRYSKYVPLHRPSRATSRATSITKDGARSPKNGTSKASRPNSASQAAKRRSTMNSRDAAYDDELLRRVIEASKEDVVHDAVDGTVRRVKRGRSNSEENSANAKRQRTGSRSASPPPKQPEANGVEASDDDAGNRNGVKRVKNNRFEHDKSEKEEKEQKERQRQEAANKRKGRAERRRAEDSDLSEELPAVIPKPPQTNVPEPPSTEEVVATVPPPGTPPTSHPTTMNSNKRASRNHHKKGKGKNQYTKDHDKEESPARSASREAQRNAEELLNLGRVANSDARHGQKNKQALAHKMSMLDMKRRVAAIMEFISRTQVDLAAENGDSINGQDSPDKMDTDHTNGEPTGDVQHAKALSIDTASSSDSKDFKELNCLEMMDVLTRDMVKWQNQYA
ncbi:hypothetical protein HIM_04780 [Hirsutella minnesotensis 3608]|uniref:Zinc finger PHD-type domain-containing protein n=1 Tax=Hirsutella minnesotensis 3608 TaxID=1043627 RepID=A0A0F7ZL38_9HYPO|nr:hypothetical protein HIM_04780 [Hirsutella minnesotensis 3608]